MLYCQSGKRLAGPSIGQSGGLRYSMCSRVKSRKTTKMKVFTCMYRPHTMALVDSAFSSQTNPPIFKHADYMLNQSQSTSN